VALSGAVAGTSGLADLDHALADYFSDGQSRSFARVHTQLDLTEEAIARGVSFDAVQGQRLGIEIQRIRSETRGIVLRCRAGLDPIPAVDRIQSGCRGPAARRRSGIGLDP